MGKASAPGKITILGEYAVLYGKLGIAAAVQERVHAEASEHENILIDLNGKKKEYSIQEAKRLFVESEGMIERKDAESLHKLVSERFPAICALAWKCLELKGSENGVHLKITHTLPEEKGLGFSSALSVAVAGAIIGHNTDSEKRRVFDASLFGDSIAHLNPSGLDCETSIKGGFISYRKGFGPKKVDVDMELPIVIGDTGTKSDAVRMVRRVMDMVSTNPAAKRWIEELDEAARDGLEALKKRDLEELAFNINKSQELLRHLRVSTPKIEDLIIASLRAGAIAAEIAGQGGGGAMFALCEKPEDVEKVAMAIEKAGGRVIKTTIGGPGLQVTGE